MIIKFIQQKRGNNRNRSPYVINYMFGKTKHKHESHSHEITKEKIDYICCSKDLGFIDPLWKKIGKNLCKISGKEADLSEIKLAFYETESNNTRVKHPFEHIVVSLKEGESLSISQWEELANELSECLGFNDHSWICVRHTDTSNHHIHLFLSAISNSAPHLRLNISHAYRQSAEIRNKLEYKFGLSHDYNPYIDPHKIGSKQSHYKHKVNEVRRCIDLAISTKQRSLPEFMQVLQKNGVGCFTQLRKGEVIGISFTLDNEKFRGSKLGLGYSWKSLTDRGVTYDKTIHQQEVEILNGNEKFITEMLKPFEKNVTISVKKHLAAYFIDNSPNINGKYKSSPSLFAFWLRTPLNSKGKTKQQIESEINQLKLIRIILALYLTWLRARDERKARLEKRLNPYISRVIEKGKLYPAIIDKYKKQTAQRDFTLIPIVNKPILVEKENSMTMVPRSRIEPSDEFSF
ncbi:hypothetical protein NBRC116592_17180 [Colwellia sp. KU-HH00111]|uniref:relaxase/mobilization nuclease domain-containing protein n=1 Tax=Colwellia sp. KU-HH00111 TaxID=3127652 RepID=UPI00310B0775